MTKNKRVKIENKPKQPKLTHFLCLPVLTPTSIPQLKASLAHLKASIPPVAKPEVQQDIEGVSQVVDVPRPLFPDAALRPLGALHLTLGVMSLEDEEKFQEAKELLESLDLAQHLRAADEGRAADVGQKGNAAGIESAEGTSIAPCPIAPLHISLEGLFDFGRSTQVSRLLALPVDPTERLVPFATAVRQHFVDAGFMDLPKRGQELRLHATLVNTVYVHKKGRGAAKRPLNFDGRELMELFEEKAGLKTEQGATGRFVWASDIDIDRAQICEMGAKKLENGMGQEYTVAAEKLIT